ncbi:hypothetical protein Avbf_03561 [Armadillidium vulgare]|nr:hypothetical protein Avbf_03561 [Armadillidium vulgare]
MNPLIFLKNQNYLQLLKMIIRKRIVCQHF